MSGRRTVLRTLVYLALVSVFVGALPWALLHYIGSPLPATWPDGALLRDWLDHPFTGMRAWKASSLLFWALWAGLAYLLAAELRRTTGPLQRGRLQIRPIEAVAAGMVGATTAVLAGAAYADADPATTSPPEQPDEPGPYVFGAHPAITTVHAPTYVVQPGDWLSAIAARFLGNPDAHPQLTALNQLLTSSPQPGERITLPPDATDHGIRLHATGTVSGAVTAGPTVPTLDHDKAGLVDGDDPDDEPRSTRGTLAGAGLLAPLMLAALTAERRRQRTYLQAGQEPPLPRSGRAERELRAAQQPADVERIAAALADLQTRLLDRTRPDIIGLRVAGGDITVLLGQPDDSPPHPWLDEDTQWTLPAYIQATASDQPPTMLPLLATVGSRAGRHLLIDLQRLHHVPIAGDPAAARDLLRHIVCELACATWSADVTILLAGFGEEAPLLVDLAPDRVHPIDVDQPAPAVRGPVVLAVARLDTGTRTVIEAVQHLPGLVILAVHGNSPTTSDATFTVTAEGTLGIDIPGLRMVTDSAYVPVDMLEPIAQVFRVARLTRPATQATPTDGTDNDMDRVLDVFEPATLQPDQPDLAVPPPTSAYPSRGIPASAIKPDATLDDDLTRWLDATPDHPRIGILGPITVELPGPPPDNRRQIASEILLYLLTRPHHAASRAEIEDALWSGSPAPEGSLRIAMTRLRDWLGQRTDATEWIPSSVSDRTYRLADGALLDWHLMQRLRDRAQHHSEHSHVDRRTALALIRGTPMEDPPTGRYRRPYTWIGDSDINPGRIIATATDIAHKLAIHSTSVGDTATTRWSVRQAWLADPHRTYDDLWLDLLAAEQHDGNTAAAQQLIAELCHYREAELPEDLHPKLYQRILELTPDAT